MNETTIGERMHAFIAELYPIPRSITGEGIRQTLQLIQRHIPLTIQNVPTGTPAFDWTVPDEWNIRDAYVKNAAGERVIDFRRHSLHVVNYSVPVHRTMTLSELRPHLHTLPDRPDWIPYRTSYYKPYWGFCLSHNDLLKLPDGDYEVCVDSTLAPGALTYGECYLPGETDDEVLISCHACHPSLADDNLSGIAVAVELATRLTARPRHLSYRFVFIPGTIGSIAWLSRNEGQTAKVKHGLVLTCLGDGGPFTYKRSRRGDADIDRAMPYVLQQSGHPHRVIDFFPYGYDERQYCSPGFNLPVGCLMRSQHGTFPEYHTSADNLDFVRPQHLQESLEIVDAALRVLEANRRFANQNPKCEPHLGKRGLYDGLSSHPDRRQFESALLWVLNYSDGYHDLLDIAERCHISFDIVVDAAQALERSGLLRPSEV